VSPAELVKVVQFSQNRGSRHFRAESDAKQVIDIARKSLGTPSHRIDLL
jgi:hypothetical protein